MAEHKTIDPIVLNVEDLKNLKEPCMRFFVVSINAINALVAKDTMQNGTLGRVEKKVDSMQRMIIMGLGSVIIALVALIGVLLKSEMMP